MMLLKNVFLNGQIHDILIDKNRFSKIGDAINIETNDTIDCTGKAILPTFCNMHTHASMMFLRGVGEDLELFDWLEHEIWPREAKLTPEMIYHLSRFAILEMIKTGTTLFLDMYFYTDQTIKAADEMGIRAAITYVGMDNFNVDETQKRIEIAANFLKEKSPSELILKGLSCHSIYTTSEELIRTFKQMSLQNQTYFHIHMSETKKEVEDCLIKHGKRPVALIDDWDILDSKTIMAHCVHLDEDERLRTAKSLATVAHCPSSNLKLNSGQMPLQDYLNQKIRVTLGTDGVSSNNSLSMLSEMKIAALSAKNVANDSTAAKVNNIFKIATSNGFEAFGIQAGKIEEGYLADFMLVDLNNCALMPNINLISNMVYSADSSCITDVFCNGKALMRDRYVPHQEEITEQFQKLCQQIF